MHRSTIICLTISGLLLALLPGAALGNVPPGNSALDQYVEQFPGSGGDQPSDTSKPRSPDRALGSRSAQRLEDLGSVGEAAAQLAARSDPVYGSAVRPQNRRGGSAAFDRADAADSSGVLAVAKHALGLSDAGGGLGTLFPFVIAGITISLIAYALSRRRRAG
jgi:hypothetical protein